LTLLQTFEILLSIELSESRHIARARWSDSRKCDAISEHAFCVARRPRKLYPPPPHARYATPVAPAHKWKDMKNIAWTIFLSAREVEGLTERLLEANEKKPIA
jgi:hypothetical protein